MGKLLESAGRKATGSKFLMEHDSLAAYYFVYLSSLFI